jgi:predicted ArsR family transcriptional regulator
VQSTRGRIIELLRRSGGATVDDITNSLALAPATVRRHLDVLLRDGLVEMRSERVPLGRPHFVFRLTETGLESVPRHQMHLVATVIDAILELAPSDTEGHDGKEVAALVFDRLAEHLVAQCQGEVTASELNRRVEQAVEVLSEAGLDFDFAPCAEGYLVQGAGCPCMRLLTGSGECVHEAGVLSGLIGTEVERVESPEVVNSRAYLVRTGA